MSSKLSALGDIGPLAAGDIFYVVRGGAFYKTTLQEIQNAGQIVATTAVSSTLAANSFTTVTAAGATNQSLPAAPTIGNVCSLKNQGAGLVTVLGNGNNIFTAASAASDAIPTGGARTYKWDGNYWNAL